MGRVIQVVLIFTICVAFGEAQFYAQLFSVTPDLCRSKDDGFHCSDCRTLLNCPNGLSMNCQAFDPAQSYCGGTPGKAACQSVSTCPAKSEAKPIEKCTSVGLYPDSLSCDVYQVCSEIGKPAVQYGCPAGTRYDAKREVCYKPAGTTSAGCYNFSAANGLCKGKPFQKITHPLREDVYVTCAADIKIETCPSKNMKYDPKHDCVFTCQEEGFFPDSGNKFITCVKNGTGWIQESISCKDGQFDAKAGYCVTKGGSSNGSTETLVSSTSEGPQR